MTTLSSGGVAFVTDPLTTIFTPPASCSSIIDSYSSWGDNNGVLHAIQNGYSPGLGPLSPCYPTNFYHHNQYNASTPVNGMYSPGVCPLGWSKNNESITSGVTTAVCCRSGFIGGSSIKGHCKKASTGPKVVEVDSTSSITVTTPFLAYDWAISIAWAASDLDKFDPKSAPILPSGAAAATSESTSKSSPSPSKSATAPTPSPTGTVKSDSTSPDSLSTGAKAGIGVGVAIGCILILLLVALLIVMLRKWRRNEKEAGESSTPMMYNSTHDSVQISHPFQHHPTEMDGLGGVRPRPYDKPELHDASIERRRIAHAELDGNRGGLPSRSTQVELPGN